MNRRVSIEWSWRSPQYKIIFDGIELSVEEPQGHEELGVTICRFEWKCGNVFSLVREIERQRVACRMNEETVAVVYQDTFLSSFWKLRQERSWTVRSENASETWSLHSREWLGLPTGVYWISNSQRRRECYWKIRSCTIGGARADLIVRRSVSDRTLPLFLCIAISSVTSFGGTGGA
jgi:hypothetical protein